MKKWMLGGIFMLLLPWLLALACMTGTGQAVWGSEERMEEEADLLPSPDGEEDNEKEAETEEAKASRYITADSDRAGWDFDLYESGGLSSGSSGMSDSGGV